MLYTKDKILDLLKEVMDPEVPVLSVIDLGIIRDVKINNEQVRVIITPTYSGCPAMDTIKMDIEKCLRQNGYQNVEITSVLSPAWTTDWMSEHGKDKLKSFGIAPPMPKQHVCNVVLFHEEEAIQCPLCHSYNTTMISRFGSTACKALYKCNECQEPFDYFKCH